MARTMGGTLTTTIDPALERSMRIEQYINDYAHENPDLMRARENIVETSEAKEKLTSAIEENYAQSYEKLDETRRFIRLAGLDNRGVYLPQADAASIARFGESIRTADIDQSSRLRLIDFFEELIGYAKTHDELEKGKEAFALIEETEAKELRRQEETWHEICASVVDKQIEKEQAQIQAEQARLQEEKDENTLRIVAALVYLVIGIIAAGALIAAYPNDAGATYTAIVIIFVPFAVAAYSAYFENPGKAILRGIGTFLVTGGISLAFFPIVWLLTL